MLAVIVFVWFGMNYAFAAQLVYLAARRNWASRSQALAQAATWPLALLRSEAVRG